MTIPRRSLLAAFGGASLVACSVASSGPGEIRDIAEFGATGDGITDDSAALQAACDGTAGRTTLSLAGRRYLIGDVRLSSGTTIIGPGVLVFRPGARHALTVNPGTEGTANPAENVHHIVLDGITFEGRSRENFRAFDYQIWLSAVSDVTIRNCHFEAFQGDAIMIGAGEQAGVDRHNERISVTDCLFDGVNKENRNAISVIDANGLDIRRCRFVRCSRPDMPGPIDIEPNPYDRSAVLADIAVVDNTFSDNGGNVANVSLSITPTALDRPLRRLSVCRNTFTGVRRSAVRLAWERHDVGPSDPLADIVVEDNTASAGGLYFCELRGLRGLSVLRNRVVGTEGAGALVGDQSAGCADVTFWGNTWTDIVSQSGSIVEVVRCRGLTVAADAVVGASPSALLALAADGQSSALTIIDNRVPRSLLVAVLGADHSTTPLLNSARGNGAAEVDEAIFARGPR